MKLPTLALAAIGAASLAAAGCGGASDVHGASAATGGGGGDTVSLVAYSTPQVVYDEIIPAFAATEAGRGVSFKSSYGASGDQSRAVEAGLDADYVTFSLQPDLERLVDAGLVDPGWDQTPSNGNVSTSVVVFAVREGNPENIRTWADLLRPGVEVVTPNPFTSGGAKWNLLAGYGAASRLGEDPEAGLAYLRELITEHVRVQDKSAREALQSFANGVGDVLLAYENEAITAQKKGEELDYVVPDDTIQIENPVAVTKDAPPAARAFLRFALSEAGQRAFAEWGYRPVDERLLAQAADRFPTPRNLFTIADLGGWDKVNAELFDPERGSVAKIEEEAGVSTAR